MSTRDHRWRVGWKQTPDQRLHKEGVVVDDVLGRPIVTAADLDAMTPQEVDDTWRASIVTDPDALPAEYIETIRRRAADRLATRDVPAAS